MPAISFLVMPIRTPSYRILWVIAVVAGATGVAIGISITAALGHLDLASIAAAACALLFIFLFAYFGEKIRATRRNTK